MRAVLREEKQPELGREQQLAGRTYLLISELSGCGPQCARRECGVGMVSSAPTVSHCCWKSRRPAENGILCPRLCPPQNCLLAEKLNHEGVDVNKRGSRWKNIPSRFLSGQLKGKEKSCPELEGRFPQAVPAEEQAQT